MELADLIPIYHCLWQEPEEAEGIREIVVRALFGEYATTIADMRLALESDIRVYRQHRATVKASKEMRAEDNDKKIYDSYYYRLINHDTGNTYIFISDYQNLRWTTAENAGQLGVLYKDRKNPQRSIIRGYDGADIPAGARNVYLTRNEAGIYIDGVYFEIEKLGKGEKQSLPKKNNIQTNRNYHQEIEGLADIIRKREEEIAGNILVSPSDKKVMESNVKTLFRELAYMREDLQKLEG